MNNYHHYWASFNDEKQGRKNDRNDVHELAEALSLPESEFLQVFKISKDMVQYLCQELEEDLSPGTIQGLPAIFKIPTEEPPDPEIVTGDFESFLSGLGSMVYKYKTAATSLEIDRQRLTEYSYSSTLPTPTSMRKETFIYNTQKAALRDVLMMKLVSYYENKYKITDHASATTDISLRKEHNINVDDALNEMKRTEHILSNLKSRRIESNEEVLVI